MFRMDEDEEFTPPSSRAALTMNFDEFSSGTTDLRMEEAVGGECSRL